VTAVVDIEFTEEEAQALADLIWEVRGRIEQNELILGPIDWDDLRRASNKLTAAIDHIHD
jgi:hypothetical protein